MKLTDYMTCVTVEEVIKRLQECNPKAIFVIPAGQGTVIPSQVVKPGVAYDFLGREPGVIGMSRFNFLSAEDRAKFPEWTKDVGEVEVVYVE